MSVLQISIFSQISWTHHTSTDKIPTPNSTTSSVVRFSVQCLFILLICAMVSIRFVAACEGSMDMTIAEPASTMVKAEEAEKLQGPQEEARFSVGDGCCALSETL